MRLLYVIIFFGVVFIGFITYLRTPVPQVNLPTDLQSPFPRPLPHTFNNLPYANTEWPSVHGGPANNDYVAVNHGIEFAWEWQALVGMAAIVAPTTGPGRYSE